MRFYARRESYIAKKTADPSDVIYELIIDRRNWLLGKLFPERERKNKIFEAIHTYITYYTWEIIFFFIRFIFHRKSCDLLSKNDI